MLFNSKEFIFVFFPITLLVFIYLSNRGWFRQSLAWLVLASLVFYAWWKPVYLFLICGSILINYFIGLQVCPHRSKHSTSTRKALMIAGVSLNLASIAWFKYAGFFAANINTVFGTGIDVGTIILPLAISFFTFQQIAYIVDAWRGETEEHNFLNYALFVTFFPQLIAGPIVSHREMLPQFLTYRARHFDYSNLAVGIGLFCLGLFKKVVIADGVAVHANTYFDAAAAGATLSFLEAWAGALAYTIQLYFDFSGYSDMALGLARVFGIRLPLNFYSPYKARSIIDFWRRWHMTLSRFLREYLYFSLGGNRKGKTRRQINLMATMLLGGLWHGAAWTFVFWGFLHGFYLVINHSWRGLRARLPAGNILTRTLEQTVYWAITFLAVVVAWVYFRADSMSTANSIVAGMAGLNGLALPIEWLGRAPELTAQLQAWHIDFKPLLSAGPMMTPLKDLAALLGNRIEAPGVGPITAIAYMGLILLWTLFAPNSQQWMHRFDPALTERGAAIAPVWPERLAVRLNLFWAAVFALMLAYSLFGTSETSQFLYFNF
ncbi:MBOAT family protein [Granulosicoccaceae sp. 1_MG-2023]|nr:MBOAT family protein [Granulosicoccaceae sp. 1_MG-2023]